jgi:transcriptional regulator with XRE-family HTH domain
MRTSHLGPALLRLRTERRIPTSRLSRETGLSRSYLMYLEKGQFQEIGLGKFARLVKALRISADDLLAEAGYLPHVIGKRLAAPGPKAYLKARYNLTPSNLNLAMKFLDTLASSQTLRPRVEPEAKKKRR